jgi:hypothetical protein
VNRRRHARVHLHADARICCGAQTITGEVENISLKGLFVKTSGQLPIGEQVEITLFFHGSSGRLSFSIQATIVRLNGRGIGFAFERIDIASLLLQTSASPSETRAEFLSFMERQTV